MLVAMGASMMVGCYLSHGRSEPDAGLSLDTSVRDAGTDAPRIDAPLLPDSAPLCMLYPPNEWIVPAAVRGGETRTEIPIGIRQRFGGCSCSARPFDDGMLVGVELCDCCAECPCVPQSYAVTTVHPEPRGITAYTPLGPTGPGPTIEVVGSDVRCAPIPEPADSVEIVVPGDDVTTSGVPVGVWAHVRGTSFRCEGTVLPLASERTDTAPPTFSMEDCRPDPGDCEALVPTPYETNAFLGFYDPGSYRLTAFGREIALEVF